MKHTLPIFVLVLGMVPAQDLEPTSDRAVAAIVRDLVAELPFRVENGAALAIDPAPGSNASIVERLVASLLKEGFRIEALNAAGSSGVPLRVFTSQNGRTGTIKVSSGDWASERRFGNAAWVDASKDDGTLVVVGLPSASPKDSLESARKKLTQALAAKFPHLARTDAFDRYVARQATTQFVAERHVSGRTVYEAYLLAEPSLDRLKRADRAVLRTERRSPWVKSGWIALAGGVLFMLYLRADLRTRGYKTTRLRFLFGTLFAVLSLGLWSLSL